MKRSLTMLLAAATLAVPVATLTAGNAGATASAHAVKVNAVVVNGHCSKGSASNLQLQREDTGKLSVDFGVDMVRHTAGIAWKVKGTDNGTAFFATTMHTISDGSFSITRVVTPKAGVNHIVAIAANPATGETCSLSASI